MAKKILIPQNVLKKWHSLKYHGVIIEMTRAGVGDRNEIASTLNGGYAKPELVNKINTFFNLPHI